MEPERVIATVHGLGRGSILGFSLTVTDRQIVGTDTRKTSVRLWLSMISGLGLGMILVVLVIFSGLEPLLFRISPILSFVGMFAIVFSIPILMMMLVPRLLVTRIRQTSHSTVQALKRDIIRIEIRKPGRITEKGYFTVRLVNGTSFSFWTVGQGMFDHVDSLLTSFAPGQITDSSISTGPFADREADRPSNRVLVGIFAFLITMIVVGGGVLSIYTSLTALVYFAIGTITVHVLIAIGYLSLRRSRRHYRGSP